MHILYLRHEYAIFVILSMGIPITTTLAGEWFNSLINIPWQYQTYYSLWLDNYIFWGQLYMSHDDHSFRAKSSCEAL